MKIIVVHGDRVEESRARLQKFIDTARRRSWEVVKIAGDKESFREAISAGNLFGDTRLFILENPLRVAKPEMKWFRENPPEDGTLVIYNDKVLSKTYLNSLPNIDKIESFMLPKAIWKFLDSFHPGNSKATLSLFHQTIESEAVEFVFAMLARHLRDLYHSSVEPESLKGPDWRVSKLRRQSSKFSEDDLRSLILNLAQIDINTKTSKASLADSLDLLMLTQLK